MRICVYGAASPTIDKEYIEKVETLGKELAKRGHSLVFGGGGNGLMGAAARGLLLAEVTFWGLFQSSLQKNR